MWYRFCAGCLGVECEMLKFLVIWVAVALTVYMTYGPAIAKFYSY